MRRGRNVGRGKGLEGRNSRTPAASGAARGPSASVPPFDAPRPSAQPVPRRGRPALAARHRYNARGRPIRCGEAGKTSGGTAASPKLAALRATLPGQRETHEQHSVGDRAREPRRRGDRGARDRAARPGRGARADRRGRAARPRTRPAVRSAVASTLARRGRAQPGRNGNRHRRAPGAWRPRACDRSRRAQEPLEKSARPLAKKGGRESRGTTHLESALRLGRVIRPHNGLGSATGAAVATLGGMRRVRSSGRSDFPGSLAPRSTSSAETFEGTTATARTHGVAVGASRFIPATSHAQGRPQSSRHRPPPPLLPARLTTSAVKCILAVAGLLSKRDELGAMTTARLLAVRRLLPRVPSPRACAQKRQASTRVWRRSAPDWPALDCRAPPPPRGALAAPRRQHERRLHGRGAAPPAHECALLGRGDPAPVPCPPLAAALESRPWDPDQNTRARYAFGRDAAKLAASTAKLLRSLAMSLRSREEILSADRRPNIDIGWLKPVDGARLLLCWRSRQRAVRPRALDRAARVQPAPNPRRPQTCVSPPRAGPHDAPR